MTINNLTEFNPREPLENPCIFLYIFRLNTKDIFEIT